MPSRAEPEARPLRAEPGRRGTTPRRRNRGSNCSRAAPKAAGRTAAADAEPPRPGAPLRTAAGADPSDPRDADPARRQLLGARAGHPDARRPGRARRVALEPDPRAYGCAD